MIRPVLLMRTALKKIIAPNDNIIPHARCRTEARARGDKKHGNGPLLCGGEKQAESRELFLL